MSKEPVQHDHPSASWLRWVRANGLETPVWFGLEVLRLGANWLAPLLDILASCLPADRQARWSAIWHDPSSLQQELEGDPEG